MVWIPVVVVAAVAAWAGLFFLWYVAVLTALGLFGIKVPVRFGMRGRETDAALRRLGRLRYAFIQGVLLFSLPYCGGMAAFSYIVGNYVRHSFLGVIPSDLMWSFLVISSTVGVLGGLWAWKKPEPAGNPARSS
jgi:hypothetical protein